MQKLMRFAATAAASAIVIILLIKTPTSATVPFPLPQSISVEELHRSIDMNALLGRKGTLAALAIFSAPVSLSDAQDPPPSIDANSTMNRTLDDRARSAGTIMASSAAPISLADSPATSSYSVDVNGARIPLFFGFIEFDWDPEAPGGVPGFGPLPQ